MTSSKKVPYLPHYLVLNPHKPYKLRVVFNCGTECKSTLKKA